jgi:peptide/nickel transport system substrate-binding protein
MLKIKHLKDGFNALYRKERIVFYVFAILLCVSFLSMVTKLNARFLVAIPEDGGSISEGIIGTPTLVNPVMALTDADKDLSSLVYSGLLRKGTNGDLIPDLAESYTVSPDGTIYTFILKDNIVFHDGSPITASDIVFTINKVQDPLVKSPKKIQWEGVTVKETDPKTIVFTLKQPYIAFLNNTTIGILPETIWRNVTPAEFGLSKLNIKGIGSGPYMVSSVETTSEGIPNLYTLTRFKKFILGIPHIKKITIKSSANEKELIQNLKNGNIDQAGGISPFYAKTIKPNTAKTITSVLPRTFGIFFNQGTNKVLANNTVRKAMDLGIDRSTIIDQVLKGYGSMINSPIPSSKKTANDLQTENTFADNQAQAINLLEKEGWKVGSDGIREKGSSTTVTTGKGKNKKTTTVERGPKTRLSFTITTGDTPELTQTAELLKTQLFSLGIEVNIKVYETGTLNQMIRARNYEVLLFGQVVNNDSDMFAFWHSSQKNDPGLNIALYNNQAADIILEQIQKTLPKNERLEKYNKLETLFKNDMPAVFIYSPQYIYAISNKINLQVPLQTNVPSDRFTNVYLWHTESDMIWKIFAK